MTALSSRSDIGATADLGNARWLSELAAVVAGASDASCGLEHALTQLVVRTSGSLAAVVLADGRILARQPGNIDDFSRALLEPNSESPIGKSLAAQQPARSGSGELPAWQVIPLHYAGLDAGVLVCTWRTPPPSLLSDEQAAALSALIAPLAYVVSTQSSATAPQQLTEADLEAVLECIGDPVAILDAAGHVQLSNVAYRSLLADAGLKSGPLTASPGAVWPRDLSGRATPPAESAVQRALSGQHTQTGRLLRMSDGHDRTFFVRGAPLRTAAATGVGAAVVLRDVSEQIARERALRLIDDVRHAPSLSGDLRRAGRAVCRRAVSWLAWVSSSAIYTLDGEQLTFLAQAGFPPRAARLLSGSPGMLLPNAAAAIAEDRTTLFRADLDHPAAEATRRLVAASGVATFVNLPLMAGARAFGVISLASAEPHEPSRDELTLLETLAVQVGAELDGVRRREQAEAEHSRLQAVLDQLPEGVLLFDAAGRLEMTNRSATALIGRQVDPSVPLLGFATRYGFMRADGRAYALADEPIARTFSSGLAVLGEEQLVRRADGSEVPVVANVAPVRDATGQLAAVILVFQDISSLREMDRLKDEFLSIASHELRSPITSIRGLAQLLHRRRDRLDDQSVTDAIATIEEQSGHMATLVDDLLDVSRIRTGRLPLDLQPCDLVPLLQGVVERARPQRSALALEIATAPLLVRGDAVRLRQVFSNLVDNALKYSETAGSVQVTACARGGQVEVAVVDHGIGVPSEALSQIFERFYRAENAVAQAGGLGLGLYLCRELVERHGGRLDVESVLGEGSRFIVRLPHLGAGTHD